jgi:hypothetical protein
MLEIKQRTVATASQFQTYHPLIFAKGHRQVQSIHEKLLGGSTYLEVQENGSSRYFLIRLEQVIAPVLLIPTTDE